MRLALTERVVVLTGGPGTGKSTVTGTILKLLKARDKSVLLAAPTGRAAKRLSEATGHPASTIHRLLEYKPTSGQTFLRDRTNPLDADLIIVDEASMLDVLGEDFVRTARAKGIVERQVLLKHALRNAAVPVITVIGTGFGLLISGVVVTESVFNLPGIGRLTVDAVLARDYPVIQALVLLFSLEFILINLIVDVLYGLINPTIRYR